MRCLSPTCGLRCLRPGLVAFVVLLVLFQLLPYDSVLRLLVQWNSQRAINNWAQPPWTLEAWVLEDGHGPPDNNINPDHRRPYDDIGVILKTGYGTRHRVPAQIEALGLRPDADDAGSVVVIADYAGQLAYSDSSDPSPSSSSHTVTVHDVIAPVMANAAMGPRAAGARGKKYRALSAAVRRGDDAEAQRISASSGWELDAMKFIPGLERAFAAMPTKPWYLLLDDDTYVAAGTLRLLLAHLDPAQPLYVGNAVGDFRGRFAHGGSAVLLSRAAVAQLLARRAVVHQAYRDGFAATWGDKLLATALMRVGVYLDERFAPLFNGARPRLARVSADRFCLPLLSFHGLADPQRMRAVGRIFDGASMGAGTANTNTTLSATVWGDLWPLHGCPSAHALRRRPAGLPGRDFVGPVDDDPSLSALVATHTLAVASPDACRVLCQGSDDDDDDNDDESGLTSTTCFAWTWHAASQTCTTAPWFVAGEAPEPRKSATRESTRRIDETTYSGLNVARLLQLVGRCGERDDVAWVETGETYQLEER